MPRGTMSNVTMLTKVLKSYCQTDEQRNLVDRRVEEMVADVLPENEKVRALAGMIHDGLSYGNWPWRV